MASLTSQQAIDRVFNNIAGSGNYNSSASRVKKSQTAMTPQDVVDRVFNHIEQNVTGPYNAGYQAALDAVQGTQEQNQSYIDPKSIVNEILRNINLSDPGQYLSSAVDLANLNTASSEAMAREQMAFQERANAKAMSFSADEAQKTRNWQTMMSNTAHQREVADLIKAGLNPVLSANAGAAVGSAANAQGVTSIGAKGNVDTSAVQALTQAYVMARQVEMQGASLAMEQKKIDAQLAMNLLSNETNRYQADRSYQATIGAANLNSSAHRYAAELDYSTWKDGLHNQYAQLGEWIYKALTGMNFNGMFNIGNAIGTKLKDMLDGDGTGYRKGYKDYETPNDFYQGPGRTIRHYNE